LTELVIVMLVIAILAAIAMPMYGDSIRRGQANQGVSNLSAFAGKLEQYYQDFRSYGESACVDQSSASWTDFVPADNENYFTYKCTLNDSGQGYVLTASGSSGRVKGSIYSIDESNEKKTTEFKGSTVSKTCWLIRGNEC